VSQKFGLAVITRYTRSVEGYGRVGGAAGNTSSCGIVMAEKKAELLDSFCNS